MWQTRANAQSAGIIVRQDDDVGPGVDKKADRLPIHLTGHIKQTVGRSVDTQRRRRYPSITQCA